MWSWDLDAWGCSFPLLMKLCRFDLENKNIRTSASSHGVCLGTLYMFTKGYLNKIPPAGF